MKASSLNMRASPFDGESIPIGVADSSFNSPARKSSLVCTEYMLYTISNELRFLTCTTTSECSNPDNRQLRTAGVDELDSHLSNSKFKNRVQFGLMFEDQAHKAVLM